MYRVPTQPGNPLTITVHLENSGILIQSREHGIKPGKSCKPKIERIQRPVSC